ncbi:hypothetical protein V499_04565 [Pseudogymnoascus sp. VKM F-103]|nr:hypothetical protein V499_04565 [Pseudogymnoascus sp. VKM F-103]
MSTITSISTGLFRPDRWALRPEDSVMGMAGREWTGPGGERGGRERFLEYPVDHHITGYLLAYSDAVFILDAEDKK